MNPDDAEKHLIDVINDIDVCLLWTDKKQKTLLPERGITINLIIKLCEFADRSFFLRNEPLYFSGEYTKILGKDNLAYPDIIFHGGQNDTSNQIFACEVKKYPAIKYPSKQHLLFEDFYKLIDYLYLKRENQDGIKEDAGFKRVYMILIECTKDDLVRLIKNYSIRLQESNRFQGEKGIKLVKKYLDDKDKKERFKFLLKCKEKEDIEVFSFEDMVEEISEFKSLIHSFVY